MKFEDLAFEVNPDKFFMGKKFESVKVAFDNGYGASIIRGYGTYGGEVGLYELAVLHNNELCYDSGLCDDVVGWLSPDEINEWLEKIEKLPKKQ